MEARGCRLLYLLILLVAACVAVLAADGGRQAATDFQPLVGGMGGGPAVDLAGCPSAFDPRLGNGCSAGTGPIPGGTCFCGRHTGLLSYPPRAGGGGHPIPD